MSEFIWGIILIVVAGCLEGLFSTGITRTPKWNFENIWLAGSLVALTVLPWPLVFFSVPHIQEVYADAGTRVVLLTVLCGASWGIGGIFWGKGIAACGMALGVSLMMALITSFGSVVPLAVFDPVKLVTPGGLTLAAAIAVMIFGVVLMAKAGSLRAKEQGASESGGSQVPFILGLMFCIISGVLSAGVNFGFIVGAPIAEQAALHGASPSATGFAIWSLIFSANFGICTLYGLTLAIKNKSFGLFKKGEPIYWFWALFMGLAWPGGIIVYGIAAGKMGEYGAYAAFPMMLLVSILAGNADGALHGEWKGTSRKPRLWMLAGVVVLFIAFVVMGVANKLMAG
jgi:L-rhamnose-H+ transport protein